MFKINKKNIFLIALPLALFGLILYAQSRKPRLLPGVGGSVTAIAFSPDGQKIVCASNNNYVQIWLPEKEKWRSFYSPEMSNNGMPGLCMRVRFSSDGKRLFAAGSAVGTQRYSQAWDVATRRRKFAFNSASNPVFDISSDGRWAAFSQRGAAYVLDLQAEPFTISTKNHHYPKDARFFRTRKLIYAIGAATSVAISPDGKTLAVGDEGLQFAPTFWSLDTGKKFDKHFPSSFAGTPSFLEWSPNGKLLAATGTNGITIYDVAKQNSQTMAWPTVNSLTNQSAAYMGGIIPIAWSPDGKTIFTGGDEVRRWRASDLKLEYSYGIPGPVAVSPDGRTLATASWPDPAGPKGVLLWKLGR